MDNLEMRSEYARLIEENGAELLLRMGRAAGAEELNQPSLHWVIGSCPVDYHNAVFHATLAPGEVDEAVRASVDCMKRQGVPGTWHVGPSMTPNREIGEALLRHGFSYVGDDHGMAIDLDRLPEKVDVPPNFNARVLRDSAELTVWRDTLAQGFGQGLPEARWAAETFARLGCAEDGDWHHYLGYLDDEPVGTASMFLHGAAAGIYFVMTVPQARRRGIGAALTLAPLQDALQRGYRVGVLGASPMGYPVYQRLGFTEYCRIQIYEYALPQPPNL